MDFRFTAHDPQTGDFLHRLPRPEKVQIGDTFGTRGTLELTYSSKALNAKTMPTFVEIRQEATFDGGMTWAPIGPSYLRLSGSHEETDDAGMREVKLVSREWLLGKARVGTGDLPLIDNKRPFYQSSPGAIMRTLLLEAKDRGAAQGIELGGFTASRDSSGNEWPKVATIYYQPGLPILNVLENLVEQGLCDYRMDGNTMRLYAPETTMGRDLTLGADPVRVHGHVTEAPVNYTLEDLTTSALLIGDGGFEVEVDNPSAPDDYGRLEATIEQGGVSDAGTARVMIDETLQKGSREIREITRTQRVDGLRHIPYRDYRVGDFVQVRDQGAWERYRVREIQAVRDDKGWTVHTVINDRLQELLLKLAKRTSGIANGSQGSGGDGTPPAPAPAPGIEPAAPEGLILDQQVYLDRQGVARGVVTASWSAVTKSTKGTAVDIGGYELWWRRNETYAEWTRAVATAGEDTTVSHSPIVLSDVDGNAMAYQWKVRAVAEESARPGPFSDPVTLTMVQDTTPPPTPSVPTVTTELRIITVEWDGQDEVGEQMPVDFNHMRVYFASTANMAGAEQVGYLTQAGSWNSGSMEPDTPVWVAISAVDNVGNESAMTDSQEVTPHKLVDDDSIRDAIEGIDDAIANAKEAAIEESVVTAGGVTVHNKTTPPVDSPGDKAHDVWQQWTTLEEGGTLVAAWMHDGTAWVKRSIVEEYVPRINIGEGTFGEMSGSRLSANSVTADKLIVGRLVDLAPSPARYPDEWTLTNGAYLIDWAAAYDGAGFRITPGGASILGPSRDTEPGDKWYISAYIGRYSGAVEEPRLRAAFYGPDGSYLTNRVVQVGAGSLSGVVVTPAGAVSVRVWIDSSTGDIAEGFMSVRDVKGRQQASATLIEDGAITTDKILANAITAGKIAALAIEADHISANAITADKIKAGAIDGKLITGARIRTAASGRRTELDVEGLRSYDSSGSTVLTTSTSDGSIELKGRLRQTTQGVTLLVGSNFRDGFPAIQWETSTNYYYAPGVTYQEINEYPETLVQGPGSASGNSYMKLGQYGNKFQLYTWKGANHTPSSTWEVDANLADNLMRIGSSTNDAPYMYFKRGTGDTGAAFVGYRHPTNDGYASMALRDRYAWMGSYDSTGTTVGFLKMASDETVLSGYLRNTSIYGGNGASIHMRDTSNGPRLQSQNVYNTTSDSGYSVQVNKEGTLFSVSSSLRYKQDVAPAGELSTILDVEPKVWRNKSSMENARKLAALRDEIGQGPIPVEYAEAKDESEVPWEYGAVAEEVDELGLNQLVLYDEYGRPDALQYEKFSIALIPIIRRLRDRVDALEQQLGATA